MGRQAWALPPEPLAIRRAPQAVHLPASATGTPSTPEVPPRRQSL